jgi:hypothetical protein
LTASIAATNENKAEIHDEKNPRSSAKQRVRKTPGSKRKNGKHQRPLGTEGFSRRRMYHDNGSRSD